MLRQDALALRCLNQMPAARLINRLRRLIAKDYREMLVAGSPVDCSRSTV